MRSAMKLGSAQGRLNNKRYKEALSAAKVAYKIGGIEDYELWLYNSIVGKSLYHLGQPQEALLHLNRAEELLTPQLAEESGTEELLSVMSSISWYIDKIEAETHNRVAGGL